MLTACALCGRARRIRGLEHYRLWFAHFFTMTLPDAMSAKYCDTAIISGASRVPAGRCSASFRDSRQCRLHNAGLELSAARAAAHGGGMAGQALAVAHQEVVHTASV